MRPPFLILLLGSGFTILVPGFDFDSFVAQNETAPGSATAMVPFPLFGNTR